jgi:(3S)-malyl-CoA thioesterase
MNRTDLRLCRSLLFLPASNPRAIEKARTLDADMIVLDLEDAVREEDKASARAAMIEAVGGGFGARVVAVRINPVGSAHFGEDVAAVRQCEPDYLVLAKAESAKQVHDASGLIARPVLAMIETPRGVLDAAAIALSAKGLIAGTNDLGASLGLAGGRGGLVYALQRVVLAARAAGIAAFDGVYNGLAEDDALAEECAEGRAWGFDGKSLIHPSQIATANRIFSPGAAEIDAARRIIAAAGGGAERHEGRMIEGMHVDQARAVLAKARL